MDRSLRLRTYGLVAILAFCLLYLMPTFAGGSLASWYPFKNKINLGLDLRGGAQFVYRIDLNKAVDDKASEVKRDIETKLADKQLAAVLSTPSIAAGALSIKVTDPAKKAEVAAMVGSDYKGIVVNRECGKNELDAICVRISSKFADDIRKKALSQAVRTVRERIDERGVAEPTVIQKDEQIIVELPGIGKDATEHVRELIARTAKLEFKIVDDNSAVMKAIFSHVGSVSNPQDPVAIDQGIKAYADSWTHDKSGKEFVDYFLTASDRDEPVAVADAEAQGCKIENVSNGTVRCNVSGRKVLERYLAQLATDNPEMVVPDDRQISFELTYPNQDSDTGQKLPYYRTYYLDRAVRLTGSAVSNAVVSYDSNTLRPEVIVEFNRYGGRLFGDLTSGNVGKKMAIILDEKVQSAPVIQSAIRQGRSNITMGGSSAKEQERSAQDLVNVLKTGSLPAPLVPDSEAELGPTLGRDAVAKAQLSFALGTLLVLIMMVSIYRWSGTIAVGGIVINVIMQLTVMCMFGATLTLPGIAALVLTVGMDVDGNILIYERIRDELNLGKSVKGAVDIGFSRAFSTILDGHMTTAAAGWVLLQYGTGPIHGFAVLLLVGIATTLFVNTWVTRLLFDWYISKKKGDLATISI
jgi:preprotein translocase subunit SecD